MRRKIKHSNNLKTKQAHRQSTSRQIRSDKFSKSWAKVVSIRGGLTACSVRKQKTRCEISKSKRGCSKRAVLTMRTLSRAWG